MKKIHIVLLVITIIMALFSAYSLAAINTVFKINFEWYSQYKHTFSDVFRETSNDRWSLPHYLVGMKMGVVKDLVDLENLKKNSLRRAQEIPSVDLNRSILLYCTLGEVFEPEFRIKFLDIAQRGNVVEIKVSINSPLKLENQNDVSLPAYYPMDFIRISKAGLPNQGKLYFIFKNQDGKVLSQKYCEI